MQELLDNLPVAWAGMMASYTELPAGTDITPLLKGLPDDMCQSPHWGYVFKGAVHIAYTDGSQEVLEAGHAYYIPPGHTAWTTDEDVAILILSPEEEEREVMAHMERRQKQLAQGSG